MPRKRQRTTTRGKWTQDDLLEAVKLINEGGISKREAARRTGIPERTIRRRMTSTNFEKSGCGPQSYLGVDAEKKLVSHIKTLQRFGFSPAPVVVRKLAYELAIKMKLPNKFNEDKGMAGRDWFISFMERNPSLSIRKAENVSVARATGMNRKDVNEYFELLETVMSDLNLINKPAAIYNMDESGFQLNNEAGKVVAVKGSKDVHHVSSTERGETITVVSCCNAEGHFLPPFCIFKGKNKKNEWQDSMPPGSDIRMNEKSAYITSELFQVWLKEHFIPRKSPGKVILLLDGHTSHMSVPVLEMAVENDITFICFPSHTTHYLQPLDRSFFRPLKHFFKEACNAWMLNHFRYMAAKDESIKATSRKIGRMQFGELLSKAWGLAATAQNAISGFKATGVVPLDKTAIPDYAFLTNTNNEQTNKEASNQPNVVEKPTSLPQNEHDPLEGTSSAYPNFNINSSEVGEENVDRVNDTPTKILNKISPIPMVKIQINKRKLKAGNITSSDFIQAKKIKEESKVTKKQQNKKPLHHVSEKCKGKNLKGKAVKGKPKCKSKKKLKYESSSDSDGSIDLMDSDESMALELDNDECAECLEPYLETTSKVDWIKCLKCERWIHESCSIYSKNGKCTDCGRMELRKLMLDKKKKIS